MQLEFEIIKTDVGDGNYPDLIHFANTQAQVFYLQDGELFGQPTNKIDNGEWENVTFQDESNASPDSGMSNFEVKVLPGWGIIGGYKAGDIHKMIIYEFAFEMDRYLNSGSIKHSIDNPISSFNLSLENPDLKDPERPGNVAISEENSLLSPGAKVKFYFGVGDDEPEFEMGTFYIDRSNFTLLSETGTVDGRNTIGKVLKDQTVDEKNEYWYDLISEQIKKLFDNANIDDDYYLIENTTQNGWFNFSPNIDYNKALETMLEVLPQWKLRELVDGTIVVGSENYNGFNHSGMYVFYRNKDIFSRQITRDDAQAYNRVCVHTENYSRVVFRDVASFQAWNLQANKTLYVQVADGLRQSDIEAYADELALRLEGVGKLESFTGPFRPHLQVGDEAYIVGDNGSKSLGLITEITHNFGKSGYYTNFTVDSGGTVGKGRLSDYIAKIALGTMAQKSDAGWNDIDTSEYINLAKYATLTVSSEFRAKYSKELLIDGVKYRDPEQQGFYVEGWEPDRKEEHPYVEFRFGTKCLVDKIMLWLAYDEELPIYDFPNYYKIQYWNSAFWVDLLEVTSGITFEMTHEFTAIETSAIRFVLQKKPSGVQHWREIEIWGNM